MSWTEDKLKSLFDSAAVDPVPSEEHRLGLRERIIAAAKARPSARRRRVRTWWPRVAAAAALLALVALPVWLLVRHGHSAAFADMVRNVRGAQSVSYRATMHWPDGRTSQHETYAIASGVVRRVLADKISITDWRRGQMITMRVSNRTASVAKIRSSDAWSLVGQLENLHEQEGTYVGSEQLDGRSALLFQVSRERSVLKIWVDLRTHLPVRVECRSSVDGGGTALEIMDGLTWNYEVNPADFSVEVPPGYTELFSGADRNSLVDLLRLAAALYEGRLPDALNQDELILKLAEERSRRRPDLIKMHADTVLGGASIGEFDDVGKERWRQMRMGLRFVENVQKGGLWHYRGGGVALGDANAVVAWWKAKGDQEYSVIYGDLRIEKTGSVNTLPAPTRPASQP